MLKGTSLRILDVIGRLYNILVNKRLMLESSGRKGQRDCASEKASVYGDAFRCNK